MLRPIREKAGLGCPPKPYYTNAIESKNNVLKQKVQYKASQLPAFIDHMKSLLQEQRMEIERALAMSGEYRLHSSYSRFGCSSQKWFRMSEDQRKKKVENFLHAPLSPVVPSTVTEEQVHKILKNPLDELNLPQHMITTMWSRAQKLVSDRDGMVRAPGDAAAWMVKSLSGSRPHYVTPSKPGGYCCDDTCLAYKSAKICSHTTAAALKGGDAAIESLVQWHKKLKSKPNFTVLSESGKPAGVGTKNRRKGMSKKISQQVHALMSDAAESDFTYRTYGDVMGPGSSSAALPPCSTPTLSASTPSSLHPSVQVQNFVPISAAEPSTINVGCPSVQVIHSQPPPLLSTEYNTYAPVALHPPSTLIQAYSPSPVTYRGTGEGLHSQQLGAPPPLVAVAAARPAVTNPFWLCFIHGNVSRCNGCKGRIMRGEDRKPLPPPDDLVIRHKEFVLFNNPRTGFFEQSREERNVYYHPWKTCIGPHFAHFNPALHIRVDGAIRERFVEAHIIHIRQEFGLLV